MQEFKELKYFVIFVGNNRSGTSLVGSFLNAHPNIICAHEFNLLKRRKLSPGTSRNQHFLHLINFAYTKNCKSYHHKRAHKIFGQPKDSWNRNIQVLGDKKSAATMTMMEKWISKQSFESELNLLQNFLNVPIKFIQLCRNPFDVITSKTINFAHLGYDQKSSMKQYFRHHDLARKIEKFSLENENFEFHKIHLEELIKEPKETLKELCEFLEVKPHRTFINDCHSILYRKPQETRRQGRWQDKRKKEVEDRISQYEDLKHYTFKNGISKKNNSNTD